MSIEVTDKPLKLTVDRHMDWLIAIEFGRVIDGKGEAEYVRISDDFRYVLSEPDGYLVGFVVDAFECLDPDEVDGIWEGVRVEDPSVFDVPARFDVPVLGLEAASAGVIATLAAVVFAGISTADAEVFHWAVDEERSGEEKVMRWRHCLAAGELKAHFGLGYSLCEVGRFREAYGHLRRYTELVPLNSWAWCWFADACVGCGEIEEARDAYQEAVRLERLGSFETSAEERLAALG